MLMFYRVTEFSGEPKNLDFEQILWVHGNGWANTIFWKATPSS